MNKEKRIINRLPVTRKALYKDVLRNRWRVLLSCSFLFLAFLLPLLIASFFKDYMVLNLLNNTEYYLDGAFTEAGVVKFRSINFVFLLIKSACILILFVYFSGIFRIYRQLIWSEGISFWSDFKKGVQQNIWQFLRYGLIFVLLYFTIWALVYFANNLIFAGIALGVSTFVFTPLVVLGMYYSVIYNTTFKQRIKNVCLLYLKNIFYILLISVLFEALFCLDFIPYIYILTKQAIILLISFFVLPLLILLGSLITIYIFDKDINNELHPDIYRKGLY